MLGYIGLVADYFVVGRVVFCRGVVVGPSVPIAEHVEHGNGSGGQPHHRGGAVGERLHDLQRAQQQQPKRGKNGTRAVSPVNSRSTERHHTGNCRVFVCCGGSARPLVSMGKNGTRAVSPVNRRSMETVYHMVNYHIVFCVCGSARRLVSMGVR